ncbi:OLC1v1013645C1 [Oldenlandia corymbosa var. corymbosa]|uniref:OLC1v1013645C1 n=1 Tax=Oldenlandia corymbosa var. corymbosa TaxID=529605 RepID=A0AAV1DZL9_OLDCO|nr:OLC1v1013645C1 [Oldenlandia corymbosa var. corymbosa]
MEAMVVCSDKNIGMGITIWDMENGDRLTHIPSCASPPHGLICLRNQYLVASQVHRSGSILSGGVIFKWPLNKITSGRLLKNWCAHHTSISCLVFSKDDSFLISGTEDGVIAVWSMIGLLDENSCGFVPSLLSYSADHKGIITGLLPTSSNANYNVISSSLDGTCKVWDVVTGKLLSTQAFQLPITAIVLDALETILFSGTENGTIFVNNFDAGLDDLFPNPNGPQVVLNGHKKSISALAFSSLGLISASDDCTVCLWDVANYVILRRFNHFKGPITNVLVVSKSSLTSSKNNQRNSTQFSISLLDKYPQPPNLCKGMLTTLPSNFHAHQQENRSTKSLNFQIHDLEKGRTPEALQMKAETNRANQMWAINMAKQTMKFNNTLQCSYLDLLHGRLLQHAQED